jgi:hypothetical protein
MSGPAASIKVFSGEPQSAVNGTAYVNSLVAQVLDANGNPVSGQTVTFIPQGQGAFVTFAGGVNTATTDVNGKATSAVITPQGEGDVFVNAWIGTGPAPGAIGPAVFHLQATQGGVFTPGNLAKIVSAWTTYKSHESTLLTDLANLINTDLTNIENDRAALGALGASDLVDLIQKRISSLLADFQPAVTMVDKALGSSVLSLEIYRVRAVAGAPVTLSVSGHSSAPPPVTQTATGQFAQLT